jgi:hypothetical protein
LVKGCMDVVGCMGHARVVVFFFCGGTGGCFVVRVACMAHAYDHVIVRDNPCCTRVADSMSHARAHVIVGVTPCGTRVSACMGHARGCAVVDRVCFMFGDDRPCCLTCVHLFVLCF